MTNFLKEFNDLTRFGLYKVVASNVEQGVENLRASLQIRHNPATQELIKSQQVSFDDFLPMQKNTTAIDPSKIDWKILEDLGLSREKLEKNGKLSKMLNWQKSDLVGIAVPYGNSSIYTEARLAFRTDDDGNIGLAVHAMRKEPQLDFPYMGYKFNPEEKE